MFNAVDTGVAVQKLGTATNNTMTFYTTRMRSIRKPNIHLAVEVRTWCCRESESEGFTPLLNP